MAGSSFKLGKVHYSVNDITSAAGTTTLANNSDYYQYVTGSTTQIIKLPDATTMVKGLGFVVVNANSSGNVTVNNNANSLIATLSPGQSAEFVVDDISTSAGVWIKHTGTGSGGSGTALSWMEVTSDTTIAANTGYIVNSASRVNLTLPATMTQGSLFAVVGKGTGGWKISTGSGQTIYDDTGSVSGSGPAINSNSSTTCVEVICITANTTFEVRSKIGTTTDSGFTIGYIAGGINGSSLTTTDKMVFSSETMSSLSSQIPSTFRGGISVSGSDRGYCMGGADGGSRQNRVDKLTYSGETYSSLGAILGVGFQESCAAQSSTKGYRLAGYASSPSNTIDSVQFSNDTRVAVSATFGSSVGDNGASGLSSSTAGYSIGDSSGPSNIIMKLTFSGETTSTPAATLSNSTGNALGTYSSTNGYRESGDTGTTVIDRLVFSSDTRTTLAATLSQAYNQGVGVSSDSKGYAAGGNAGTTTINALVFSGETNGSISSVLSSPRQNIPGSMRV